VSNQRLIPGQKVQFKLADIHLPDIAEVLSRMTDDVELIGQITLLSDQGEHRSAFAVIEVKGILMPLIVPASCLTTIAAQPIVAAETPPARTPEITTRDVYPAPKKDSSATG
jgi:hypothetical protein